MTVTTGTRLLNEVQVRQILSKAGVPVNRYGVARTLDEGLAVAGEIGYPVVLKVVSSNIPHKSDVGGVIVGIKNEQEFRDAWSRMQADLERSVPGCPVDGFSVQQMIHGVQEVYIGMKRDQLFGVTVLFGLGGIWVELLRDVSMRLYPFDLREAREMVAEVRASQLLTGYRGRPRADVDAVARMLVQIGQMAENHPELLELDLNPVMVLEEGQGALAVDAHAVVAAR